MSIQAAGITDPQFHWVKFWLAPVELVRDVLKAVQERTELVATFQSVTPAKIGLMFSGADSKLTLQDLLPFAIGGKIKPRLSEKTQGVLKKLVARNSLPDKVVAAWSKEISSLGRTG